MLLAKSCRFRSGLKFSQFGRTGTAGREYCLNSNAEEVFRKGEPGQKRQRRRATEEYNIQKAKRRAKALKKMAGKPIFLPELIRCDGGRLEREIRFSSPAFLLLVLI
jgi:hypothetical protein